MLKICKDIEKGIGNTPLIELTKFDTGLCKIYMKLEHMNPSGSIKDRIALFMLNDLAKRIPNGSTIVEASSGNTAISIATLAIRKGYNVTSVVYDKASREKIACLKSLGAKVIIASSSVDKNHPDYYLNVAAKIGGMNKNHFYINQFVNRYNPLAHERTTAPEIYFQLDGKIDVLICGVGTSGHFTGISRFLKKKRRDIETIIVDPIGALIAEYVNSKKFKKPHPFLVEGVGENMIHKTCEIEFASLGIEISDRESFHMMRKLAKSEGIFAGPSTGLVLAGALKYCATQTRPKNIVTFSYDRGFNYLSTGYNDNWMKKHNLL